MVESGIIADINNIKDDIREIKEMVMHGNKATREIVKNHMDGCGANRFFQSEANVKKLYDTIYEVEFRSKEESKKQVFYRWLFSLPIAGLVIDRIVSLVFSEVVKK